MTQPMPNAPQCVMVLQAGDHVIYSKFAGTDLDVAGSEHVLLKVRTQQQHRLCCSSACCASLPPQQHIALSTTMQLLRWWHRAGVLAECRLLTKLARWGSRLGCILK